MIWEGGEDSGAGSMRFFGEEKRTFTKRFSFQQRKQPSPITYSIFHVDSGQELGSVVDVSDPSDTFAAAEVTLGNLPGIYNIVASCDYCAGGFGSTVKFTATAKPIETIIEKIPGEKSGDGQRDQFGAELPIPFRIRVVDTDGTLRPDVVVNFSQAQVPAQGSFANPNPATDANGIASTFYTLGGAIGEYRLQAFCSICATNPGNTVSFIARASSNKPAIKKNHEEGPATRSNSGCRATIKALGRSPSGAKYPAAPGEPFLTCSGNRIRLECGSEQYSKIEHFSPSCSDWTFEPTNKGSFELKEISGLNATFAAGTFGFSEQTEGTVRAKFGTIRRADDTPLECAAERAISVGVPSDFLFETPVPVNKSEKDKGISRGEEVLLKTKIRVAPGTDLDNPDERARLQDLVGFLTEVAVLDVNGLSVTASNFGFYDPRSLSLRRLPSEAGTLLLKFKIRFKSQDEISLDQLPKQVKIEFKICGTPKPLVFAVKDETLLRLPGGIGQ